MFLDFHSEILNVRKLLWWWKTNLVFQIILALNFSKIQAGATRPIHNPNFLLRAVETVYILTRCSGGYQNDIEIAAASVIRAISQL